MTERCHCGRPLHYTDPKAEQAVRDLIALAKSEYFKVFACGRAWLVQRHYVALHGLNAQELPELGFQEIYG